MKTQFPRMVSNVLIGACLLAAISNPSGATEIYRWKDANGDLHFSDEKSAAEGARTMNIDAPERQPNPELDQYRKTVHANLAALDAERAQAAKEAETRKIIAQGVQKNCRQLRNALRAEETAAALYTFDDKGEMHHLDDQQRAKYKDSLNQQWQRYCD